MIGSLASRGVRFSIATGRLFASARTYARALGLDTPIIASSGAVIGDPASGAALRDLRIDGETALRVLRDVKDAGEVVYLFAGDQIWANRWTESTERYSKGLGCAISVDPDLAGRCRKILRDLGEAGQPTSIVIRTSPEEAHVLRARFQNRYRERVRVTSSMPHFVDFLHPLASKRLALEHLATYLGLSGSKIMAIGDGENDLDMLEFAGVGVLVSNAPEHIQHLADFVTSAPFADGVAEAISRFVYAA